MQERFATDETAKEPVSMRIEFPQPHHFPCSQCGAALARAGREDHVCERDRLIDYQMFHLRPEVAAIEDAIAAYLASPRGRFALWCAERDRGASRG